MTFLIVFTVNKMLLGECCYLSSQTVKKHSPLDFYPHKIALFSGGLSTRLTPTPASSTGLLTPPDTEKGGERSELCGEVKGELLAVLSFLLSGVEGRRGRAGSHSDSLNL